MTPPTDSVYGVFKWDLRPGRDGVPMRIVLLGLLLALPAATAWSGPGGNEPDTRYDRETGRMFTDANLDASRARVYFHAWQAVEGTSLSPNAALTHMAILHPRVHHRAMLGVWTDCDRDGYIGNAGSALVDYPAELADPTVCPPGSRHSDGDWVTELVAIGMVDPCEFEDAATRQRDCPNPGNVAEPTVPGYAENEVVRYSTSTYVWGDVGAPGDPPPPALCVLSPAPYGTTSGTGPLIAWADCQEGGRLAPLLHEADPDGARNASFPVTLFGAPDGRVGLLQQGSDAPAATTFDCDARTPIRDPTGGALEEVALKDPSGGRLTGPVFPLVVTGYTFQDEDGNGATPGVLRLRLAADDQGALLFLPRPAPTLNDPSSSWWDATEASVDATRGDCDPRTRSDLQTRHPGPAIESADAVLPPPRKDRTSFVFTFYDGHRGLHKDVDPITGPRTPSDAGLLALRHGRGGAGPLWSATAPSEQDPQLVSRGSLEPTPALTFTYYASLGVDVIAREGLRLPTDTSGVYGSQACGTLRVGEANGWECDPAKWWRDAAGNDATPRYAQGARLGRVPGDPYDLVDVDCYDGTVERSEGIRASLVDLSRQGACER